MAQLTAPVQTQPQSKPSAAADSANGTSHNANGAQLTLRFPRQGEWTYEDWLQFPDDGWKYEIIDGVLYMSPPPAIIHQDTSLELAARMRIFARENRLGKVLEAPCGVRLPNQSVPVEPDILFVKQARRAIIGKNYIEGAPDLVVEILSPSNPSNDLDVKYHAYEAAGVPEYWIVNYQAQLISVYHLADDKYQHTGTYGMGDTIESRQLDGFVVAVAEIFELD